LHIVALLEATKGLLVFAAGIGALSLLNRDASLIAEKLVRYLLLNPDGRTVHFLVERAEQVTNQQLIFLAGGAMLYSGMRFAEAYGLWKNRAWAEWLAVLGGMVYLPFEISAILHRATVLRFSLLGLNLLIVGYVARVLYVKRKARKAAAR
jgi:uncharacterized membrane protein (DUF2068 family)